MTNQEFPNKVIEIVRNAVNTISEDDFLKLGSIIVIHNTWCSPSGKQDDGLNKFKAWLKGQLKMWEEDEGVPFRIDKFSEEQLDFNGISDGVSLYSYQPTSYGEDLDFWFEFKVKKSSNSKIEVEFNVNI